MEQVILCDIDMTILDTSDIIRKTKDLVPPKRWDVFYAHLHEQKEMTWCIEILKRMNMPVIFLTGRCETYKDKTVPALDRLGLNYQLIMRAVDDFREDADYKEAQVKELLEKYNIMFAIDDRVSNCKMFYKYGIPVLQVYYPEDWCVENTEYVEKD